MSFNSITKYACYIASDIDSVVKILTKVLSFTINHVTDKYLFGPIMHGDNLVIIKQEMMKYPIFKNFPKLYSSKFT